MHIQEGLKNIIEGKLDVMRENFVAALTEKAVEKLDEKKQEIAKSYFGQKDEKKK